MKILIYNWRDLKHSWAGGGEVYIFEQASRWVKMGHKVTVFCGKDPEKNLPSTDTIDGIEIYRRGGRYSLYLWAFWYYLTLFRNKFDIVIDVENGIPFFTPLFCRIPKICYVYHVHASQWFYETPFPLSFFGNFIERHIFPLIYQSIPIIAISETTKEELIKIGFKKKNISILYSGIYNNIKTTNHKFIHPTILYLGRIKKYKRVDMLVNIFPKVLEKIPNARLIIAGWGTEASIVTNLVMRNNFRRKITLLGPVTETEKKNLLSKSWVFVNPSIGEGWGIAVIEANAYATPAIAFNVPGLAESIKHTKTGLLVKNEEDLLLNIISILTKPTLRKKLSKNALEWAKTFNWDKSSKKALKIFQDLVDK